jgi:hypothetical protein
MYIVYTYSQCIGIMQIYLYILNLIEPKARLAVTDDQALVDMFSTVNHTRLYI